MAQWHYYKSEQQFDPVDDDALRGLIASGELLPDDLVWNEEMQLVCCVTLLPTYRRRVFSLNAVCITRNAGNECWHTCDAVH